MMPRASLAIKVPAVAAVFLLVVSLFISERVLSRLAAIQTAHLVTLTRVHLDGLSTALVDAVLREDVWEVYAVLDRTRQGGDGLTAAETIVSTSDGRVIASTDPRRIASNTMLPADYPTAETPSGEVVLREPEARAYVRRDVIYNGRAVGSIHAKLDIASLLEERRRVLWTLILSNAALTLALVITAWITVRRMMRPVAILAAHLEDGIGGEVTPIPPQAIERAGHEFRRLFAAFNTLALNCREREELIRRLADEEKLASLGRLASGMAHEINNPLGGLFNAVDTLKRHGARPLARADALDLIDRGLRGIRDIVRTTLATYRADGDRRGIETQDLDDLKVLAAPELRRNDLVLVWDNGLSGTVDLPSSHLRQIALNLLLNACNASPRGGAVSVRIGEDGDCLRIAVADDGPGMPAHAAAILTDTTGSIAPIGRGHGLGLWMTGRLIRDLHGTVEISRSRSGGALVTVALPLPRAGRIAHVA